MAFLFLCGSLASKQCGIGRTSACVNAETARSGGVAGCVKAEAPPPHSKVRVGHLKVDVTRGELTRVAADLIFEDYPALVGVRLVVVRGKTGRTYRDAAGNRQNLRTETD